MEKQENICPVHKVVMKRVRIIYGLVEASSYEKEIESGDVILGGCCEGEFGDYGYVCPVDNEWYVIKGQRLTRYEDT